MKSMFLDSYTSSGSDTEGLPDSSSDSELELDELPCDFSPIWVKLRDVLTCPGPLVAPNASVPLLSDMVMHSHDIDFRPNTVVLRMYSVDVYTDVAPLPPISEKRKSQESFPLL